MALSTNTISTTIEWAKKLSFNRNPVIGNSLEPALSSAQMVMDTILGPPFTWWWNATEVTFTCNPSVPTTVGGLTATTTQDYTTPTSSFSHIEHVSVFDINQTPPKWIELEVKNNLSLDSNPDRPRFISPEVEDGSGNVTWRVMPAPDVNYPIAIHIQNVAPRIISINQTWSPIPDFMQYVYNWGFLALIWAFADDPRFQIANQKFVAGLLARAEGISDEERNAFLNAWHNLTGHEQMEAQQGMQMRGV